MAYRMMSHVAIVGRMMNTFVHNREQHIVITNLIPCVVKKSVYTAHAQVCGLVERGVSRFLLTVRYVCIEWIFLFCLICRI